MLRFKPGNIVFKVLLLGPFEANKGFHFVQVAMHRFIVPMQFRNKRVSLEGEQVWFAVGQTPKYLVEQ